jgi:hypothetical protein
MAIRPQTVTTQFLADGSGAVAGRVEIRVTQPPAG